MKSTTKLEGEAGLAGHETVQFKGLKHTMDQRAEKRLPKAMEIVI